MDVDRFAWSSFASSGLSPQSTGCVELRGDSMRITVHPPVIREDVFRNTGIGTTAGDSAANTWISLQTQAARTGLLPTLA